VRLRWAAAAAAILALAATVLLAGTRHRQRPSAQLDAAAVSRTTPARPLAGTVRPRILSRPGGVSRYAFVDHPTAVRARPDPGSPALGRLSTRTADDTSELVLLLSDARGSDGQRWMRVRTPLLPAGTTGWIPRAVLDRPRRVRTWVLVDRRAQRLTLMRSGRVVLRARIGIGKPGTPTPAGRFYIRDRLTDLDPRGLYGPEAFGTSARSERVTDWPGGSVVGIHGTNRPDLVPGRPSHGCIRLHNRDIRRLARLMPVGTPLTIR
jgi:lipoprotein-anchoring transpeptidase ErfK/SrfK